MQCEKVALYNTESKHCQRLRRSKTHCWNVGGRGREGYLHSASSSPQLFSVAAVGRSPVLPSRSLVTDGENLPSCSLLLKSGKAVLSPVVLGQSSGEKISPPQSPVSLLHQPRHLRNKQKERESKLYQSVNIHCILYR